MVSGGKCRRLKAMGARVARMCTRQWVGADAAGSGWAQAGRVRVSVLQAHGVGVRTDCCALAPPLVLFLSPGNWIPLVMRTPRREDGCWTAGADGLGTGG